jgi:hypothetical protein
MHPSIRRRSPTLLCLQWLLLYSRVITSGTVATFLERKMKHSKNQAFLLLPTDLDLLFVFHLGLLLRIQCCIFLSWHGMFHQAFLLLLFTLVFYPILLLSSADEISAWGFPFYCY